MLRDVTTGCSDTSVDTTELWSRFGADLRAFVARRVPESDVDDVVQDVFLRIHRGLGGLADRERVAGWVYRVARSAVVDHHRRRRDASELPESLEAPSADDPEAVQREVAGWLAPLIATLPEPHREALTLVELEGVTQADLARRLGLSPSGARTRVQRARAELRRRLLRCCELELDARGTVVDYSARDADCC